jgi:hypothetical protein
MLAAPVKELAQVRKQHALIVHEKLGKIWGCIHLPKLQRRQGEKAGARGDSMLHRQEEKSSV